MPAKRQPKKFTDALEEHGADGVEILIGKTSFLAHGVIYILMGLLLALLIWSFYGKTDVIISAEGRIDANSEMRLVYAPTAGELTDIYVSEGMRVSMNDLLARVKSTGAIRAATDAEQAKMKLERAELEKNIFPQKKKLLEKEIGNIRQQIKQKKKEYKQLNREKFKNLPAAQKYKLEKTRLKFEEAEKSRDMAKQTFERYSRLFETSGHGGVSKKEIDDKKAEYMKAETVYRDTEIDLENLELEFSKQDTEAGKKISDTRIAILTLRFQLDSKMLQMKNEEKQTEMQYRAALASYTAASVVTFDDLDADNFLKIRAPISGAVTFVTLKQRGEKIKPEVPLISIAPVSAEKILRINILDKDRGLLRVGQSVKLKFAAFPYQQYGFINGTLEHISPNTTPSEKEVPYYRGRVGLERDYFMVDDKKIHLKYGMTAKAEIVVRKRRLIDFILDPFRRFNRD